MKTVLILDKVSLAVLSRYQAEDADQSKYGGPWGDPNLTVHVALEEGLDPDCIEIAYVTNEVTQEDEILVVADQAKLTAKAQAQAEAAARAQLAAAKAFGNKVIEDFTLENMAMGITLDGMTGTVRKATAEVIAALSTGSLYDAMDEARAIPADKKDVKYITDARLLAAVNKIETFLGLPLSETL